jgi:hypothetical protein
MSRSQRDKGLRAEREIVDRHKALNISAERYPLSGASRFRGSGHDVDLYLFGRDAAPLVAEVKARGNGSGFTQLEKWLGDYNVLFLRRDRADSSLPACCSRDHRPRLVCDPQGLPMRLRSLVNQLLKDGNNGTGPTETVPSPRSATDPEPAVTASPMCLPQ